MNRRNFLLICVMSGFFGLAALAAISLSWEQAMAAPLSNDIKIISQQPPPAVLEYISISALAFQPTQPTIPYIKDVQRQLLSLTNQGSNSNIFVAPLVLPDRDQLQALTIFGEDFDSQGEIRLRLKRCDHSQARCVTLADVSSTLNYASGQFESARVTVPNEVVDNRFYGYFLELELTARLNSGLRSARLELVSQTGTPPPGNQERWSLSGDVYSFPIPILNLAQVRVCTDDLSHLSNVTHHPFLEIDNDRIIPLSSNNCITAWGRDIEIQRQFNTGPSSGTYQILR